MLVDTINNTFDVIKYYEERSIDSTDSDYEVSNDLAGSDEEGTDISTGRFINPLLSPHSLFTWRKTETGTTLI